MWLGRVSSFPTHGTQAGDGTCGCFLRQTKEEGEGELRRMCTPKNSSYGCGECEAELQRVLVPPGVLISGGNLNGVNCDRKFGATIRARSGEKGQ